MFRQLQEQPLPFQRSAVSFIVHSLLAGPASVVLTLIVAAALNLSSGGALVLAALHGALLAGIFNRQVQRGRVAAFVWILPFFLITYEVIHEATAWDPRWARMPRWAYVKNELFGPNCSASECLATVFVTMPAISMASYSIIAFFLQRQKHRLQA